MQASRDVLLQTEDLAGVAALYEKHLGLKRVVDEPTLIGLEAGAFRLYLERGPAYGPVFEFFVPDLEASKAALVAAGCTIDQEDASIPRCYIRDPCGLIFNLAQKKPETD